MLIEFIKFIHGQYVIAEFDIFCAIKNINNIDIICLSCINVDGNPMPTLRDAEYDFYHLSYYRCISL